jgi:hypothetical protein
MIGVPHQSKPILVPFHSIVPLMVVLIKMRYSAIQKLERDWENNMFYLGLDRLLLLYLKLILSLLL